MHGTGFNFAFPVIKIPALNLKMWGKHDENVALLVACAPFIIAIIYGLIVKPC